MFSCQLLAVIVCFDIHKILFSATSCSCLVKREKKTLHLLCATCRQTQQLSVKSSCAFNPERSRIFFLQTVKSKRSLIVKKIWVPFLCTPIWVDTSNLYCLLLCTHTTSHLLLDFFLILPLDLPSLSLCLCDWMW